MAKWPPPAAATDNSETIYVVRTTLPRGVRNVAKWQTHSKDQPGFGVQKQPTASQHLRHVGCHEVVEPAVAQPALGDDGREDGADLAAGLLPVLLVAGQRLTVAPGGGRVHVNLARLLRLHVEQPQTPRVSAPVEPIPQAVPTSPHPSTTVPSRVEAPKIVETKPATTTTGERFTPAVADGKLRLDLTGAPGYVTLEEAR